MNRKQSQLVQSARFHVFQRRRERIHATLNDGNLSLIFMFDKSRQAKRVH